MKNYGNLVSKYISAGKSSKYKPILASSNNEYNEKQLADLKRFIKEDFSVGKNRDNQGHYNAMVNQQKKIIEKEIKRLEAQVGSVKRSEAKVKAAKERIEEAAREIAVKKELEIKERKRKSKLKIEKAKAEAEARAEAETVVKKKKKKS